MGDVVSADHNQDDVRSKVGHEGELSPAHVGNASTTHREDMQADRAAGLGGKRGRNSSRVAMLDATRSHRDPRGVTQHHEDDRPPSAITDQAVGRALRSARRITPDSEVRLECEHRRGARYHECSRAKQTSAAPTQTAAAHHQIVTEQ
ncbi:MAG: hypothetical protein NVSMB29_09570 [Candidatus Dormibacteria bacterium]